MNPLDIVDIVKEIFSYISNYKDYYSFCLINKTCSKVGLSKSKRIKDISTSLKDTNYVEVSYLPDGKTKHGIERFYICRDNFSRYLIKEIFYDTSVIEKVLIYKKVRNSDRVRLSKIEYYKEGKLSYVKNS